MTSCNRICPSVEGSTSPLITHRIGVDVCLAQQRTFFHKCHRCIYRGKAANWEPERAPQAALDLVTGEKASPAEVKQIELPARRRTQKAPAEKVVKGGRVAKSTPAAKTVESDA